MRYSFSGTTKPSRTQLRQLGAVVASLKDGSEFTTGLAPGIDTEAMLEAHRQWPDALHRVVVPRGACNTKARAYAAVNGFEIEVAPVTSHPYRPRNTVLVQRADVLLAFPEGPEEEFPRSGTWMTVRIARTRGVTSWIYEA